MQPADPIGPATGSSGRTVATASGAAAASGRRLPDWAIQALQLFALCGFAFAQPIFDLLGNNATFFVAHDATGWRVVLFTAILLFVPPLVLFVVLRLIHLVWSAADRVAMAVVVGGLVSLFIVPAIDRSQRLDAEVYGLLGLAVAGGVGFAFYRLRAIRTFAGYLSPAPILFAVIFLFTTPVSDLLSSGDPGALAGFGGRDTPVVVIIFDELPLGTLLDQQGNLDTARYPGFAELAAGSTWYPRATTVAPWTYLAVPAIQSGRLPSWGTLPFASSYPRSLFTMLGNSHELHVNEAVTRNCPKSLCEGKSRNAETDASLTDDSLIAYLHTVLPASLEDKWLPTIGNSWAGFGQDTGDVQAASDLAAQDVQNAQDWVDERAAGGDRKSAPTLFGDFLQTIKGPAKAGLWYQHVLSPHPPFVFLPEGQSYPTGRLTDLSTDTLTWGSDPDLLDVARQQFMLQVGYVDTLVGQTVQHLKDEGVWDEAMVVVASDHGMAFEENRNRRGVPLTDTNRDQILPVPLFVKYPGDQTGTIDRRAAQTVDVLPTIADALGIDLPPDWAFDGQSLLDDPAANRKLIYMDSEKNSLQGGERKSVNGRAKPELMAESLWSKFAHNGDDHDLYRLGAYGILVGRPADSLASGSSDGRVTLDDPASYANVQLAGGSVPAFFGASVEGLTTDDWVAVSLNGTIAGVGPVYEKDGSLKIAAMLDPAFLRNGSNEVTVYAIRDNGRSLVRVPTGG